MVQPAMATNFEITRDLITLLITAIASHAMARFRATAMKYERLGHVISRIMVNAIHAKTMNSTHSKR